MSFEEVIAETNRELAIYRAQLNSFNARKQSLAEAKDRYLSNEVGSKEYLANQRAYYLLVGHPIPLPREQYIPSTQTNAPPPSKRKRAAVPKKQATINVRKPQPTQQAPNSNARIHNAAKLKVIQDAIQSTFKFKTLAECTGRKFVTREELINAIKTNKILSAHVGDIRKNISKEDLCQKLFSKPV